MIRGVQQLPKWVTSNDESVWRETESSRGMSPAERWRDVVAACDTLKLYWNLPGYPDRIRRAEDPVSLSTQRALERLRAEFKRSAR